MPRAAWVSIVILVFITLLSGCDVISGPSSVDDIVLTTALNDDYCPVDDVTTFSPDSALYCSVLASNLRSGSFVASRWYYGEQFIEEINYEVQEGGRGCVGFELTSPNPWPRGSYRVEIYLNGHLERMATFAVT